MTALDPHGTCHLVNCPGKGVHPPHGIGAPTQESYDRQMRERKLGAPDGSAYSLNYVWARQRVILHVHTELTPEQAGDLAASLRWFEAAS